MDGFINYGFNNNRGFLFWRTLVRKGKKWQKVIHLFLEVVGARKEKAYIAKMLVSHKIVIKNPIGDKEDKLWQHPHGKEKKVKINQEV